MQDEGKDQYHRRDGCHIGRGKKQVLITRNVKYGTLYFVWNYLIRLRIRYPGLAANNGVLDEKARVQIEDNHKHEQAHSNYADCVDFTADFFHLAPRR